MSAPRAIDLFCGLGGWTEGLLAEGYEVIGFDIEQHVYGEECYPAQLVIHDVLTLCGSQFKDVDLIVASPPCQEYSYMAMPWSRAKAKAAAILADETGTELERLNRLFNACFRIQREACEAAGRHIPMVVENVRGAQPWVGRARWAFGSYYLWGDTPALMPTITSRPKFILDDIKNGQRRQVAGIYADGAAIKNGGGSWFSIGSPNQKQTGQNPDGRKLPGFRFDGSGRSFQTESVREHLKVDLLEGGRRDHPDAFGLPIPNTSHGGSARKAASAKIAKIPLGLARHIGRCWKPVDLVASE
jgi:hypothetical protein